MKRILYFLAVLSLLLCFTGCMAENKDVSSESGERGSAVESKSLHASHDSEQKTEQPFAGEPSGNTEGQSMKIIVKSTQYEVIYELNDSTAAKELYAQLPQTCEAEPFSNNEITFYPPDKLNTADTPFSKGDIGSLSYYAPWGDVVMFYAPCQPNGSLYEIGTAVSGAENIEKLTGTITISVYE